jgi:prepilin-type N-terminal cleavage/methylation domain-containing protein
MSFLFRHSIFMEKVKQSKGFSLVEMLITLSIIGILAALSINTYQNFIENSKLRQASTNLYLELKNLRQVAHRYDCKVFVRFYAAQCSVYVDTNNNGVVDASDKVIKVIKFTSSVSIGIASNGPTAVPTDLQTITGMTGNWGTLMIVKNDDIGTTNSGAVYLQSKRLSKITYCIGIASTMLAVKQYKWGGSSWTNL